MLRGSPFVPGKVSDLSFAPFPCAGYRSLETLTRSKQNKTNLNPWALGCSRVGIGGLAWDVHPRHGLRVDSPTQGRTLTGRKVTALKEEAVSGYRGKGLSNFSLTLSQNDWLREDNGCNGKEELRTELHNSAK